MKRLEPAADVAVVIAAIVFAWGLTRLALYPALGIPDTAPAILRPILGFLAAWAMLRKHGIFYVLLGRNLWPLIAVHGVWNTVGIWGTYAS
jgi:hypothetical protein